MHCEKYNKSGLGNLLAHFERKDNRYRKYKNENINKEKTYLNYNLAPQHEEGLYKFVKNRVTELNIIKRANAVWCCDWCLSAPREIVGDYKKCKEFFQLAYDFLEERYGKDNVVSCFCHYDEGLPDDTMPDRLFHSAHCHFCFIPVITSQELEFSKETGELVTITKEKVSAKERINRTELSTIHNQMQSFLNENLPFTADILNGATKGGNLSVEQLKYKTELQKEINQYENQLSELKEKIQMIATNFINLTETANHYSSKISEKLEKHDEKVSFACSQISNLIDSYDVSLDSLKHQLEIRDNTLISLETNYTTTLELMDKLKATSSELEELSNKLQAEADVHKAEISDEFEL